MLVLQVSDIKNTKILRNKFSSLISNLIYFMKNRYCPSPPRFIIKFFEVARANSIFLTVENVIGFSRVRGKVVFK